MVVRAGEEPSRLWCAATEPVPAPQNATGAKVGANGAWSNFDRSSRPDVRDR
jgi:hypothetical protein